MYWKNINSQHHGKKVSVSAISTPRHPDRGERPYIGYIVCPNLDSVPLLRVGNEVHTFAWYWEVEFLDESVL